MRIAGLPLALVALVSTAAAAADVPKAPKAPPPPAVTQIMKCRSLQDADARLRCYDTAAAGLAGGIASGDIVALDRNAIAKERRSLFGFALPRIGLFGGGGDEPRELNATIRAAHEFGDRRWSFTLDDGGRWQTIETVRNRTWPRAGDKVRIQRGALAGYMMSIEGGPLIRVTRIE